MEKFDQFKNKAGFTDIEGKKVQIGVGEIKEFDDHIEIETLGGCSRTALEDAMHNIANEYKKTVKAPFQDK